MNKKEALNILRSVNPESPHHYCGIRHERKRLKTCEGRMMPTSIGCTHEHTVRQAIMTLDPDRFKDGWAIERDLERLEHSMDTDDEEVKEQGSKKHGEHVKTLLTWTKEVLEKVDSDIIEVDSVVGS